jgi:hypothetical protein
MSVVTELWYHVKFYALETFKNNNEVGVFLVRRKSLLLSCMRQIYIQLVESFGDTPLQVLSMRHVPSVLNQTTWMNLRSSTNPLQEFLTKTFEVLKHFFEATRGHPSCYPLPNNFEWRVLEAHGKMRENTDCTSCVNYIWHQLCWKKNLCSVKSLQP